MVACLRLGRPARAIALRTSPSGFRRRFYCLSSAWLPVQLPKHCYERAMVALPAVDPAFRVSGSTPGLELWRIENLKPVRQEAVTGLFFDAYILSYYTEKV
ncbi:hypothetical protein VYU27_002177 [Nannochloropsis oceanica]